MAKELYNFGIPGKQPKVYTLEHKMGLVTPTHKIDVYKRDLRDLKDSQQIKGSDTQYKLNLAKTYLNIAVLEPYENNNNKWKYFGSAAILCKELLSSGTNEEYASTLAMIYENHAIARNTSENKIHYYELALKQYEQLSESHPANAQYKTSLTRIYINMHDLTGVDIYQSKAMQLSKSLTVSDEETLEHINNFIRDVLRSPIDQRAFHCEEAWSLCKKLKIPTKVDDYPVQYLLSLANMYSNMVALFSNTRNYYPGQNMPLPKASLLNHDKDAIRLFIARMSWELRQIKSSNIIKQNEDKILAANSITDPQERNLHIAYYNVIIGMEMAAQAEKTGQFNKAWELLGKISIPEQLDENDTRFFRLVTTYNKMESLHDPVVARPPRYLHNTMALCLTLKKLNDGLAKKGEYIPEYMENLAKLCITLGSNPIEPRQGLSEKDQKIYQNNMKNLYLKKARALYQTLNETYRGNKNWENGRKAVDVLIRFNDKSSDVCDRTKRIVQNTLPSLRREIIESPENINAISALASLLRTEVAVSKREAPQLELALLKELLPYEQLLANSDPTNKTLQENYNTSKDRIEALTKPKGFTDRIKSALLYNTHAGRAVTPAKISTGILV